MPTQVSRPTPSPEHAAAIDAATTDDNESFVQYTGRAMLERSLRTLQGLLEGITIDQVVTDAELKGLAKWLHEHRQYQDRKPFSEVIDKLTEILANHVIDAEERADMLWMCGQLEPGRPYFDSLTADMQRLQGVLGGIISDGKIRKAELVGLQDWFEQHPHLRSVWPYDELETHVAAVLKDGQVDAREHAALLQFFGDFVGTSDHSSLELPEDSEGNFISGVCALAPDIQFEGRVFCLTGSSDRATKADIYAELERRGADWSGNLTAKVDYLVIGAKGSPCWTFSCYGRKVEQAVQRRRDGGRVVIVHEHDLWDAIDDFGM